MAEIEEEIGESLRKRMKQDDNDRILPLGNQRKIELFQLIEERRDLHSLTQNIERCLRQHIYMRALANQDTLAVRIESMHLKDDQNEEVLVSTDSENSLQEYFLQLLKMSNKLTHHTEKWEELTKGMSRSDIDALYYEESKWQGSLKLFGRIRGDFILLELLDQLGAYSAIQYNSCPEDVLTDQIKDELRTKVPYATDDDISSAFSMYVGKLYDLHVAEHSYKFLMFLWDNNYKKDEDLDTIRKNDEFIRQKFDELPLLSLKGTLYGYRNRLHCCYDDESKLALQQSAEEELKQKKAMVEENYLETPLRGVLFEARKRGYVFNANADDPEGEILRIKNACPGHEDLFKY